MWRWRWFYFYFDCFGGWREKAFFVLWKQKDQDTRLFEKRTETCAETNTKVDTSIFKERTRLGSNWDVR